MKPASGIAGLLRPVLLLPLAGCLAPDLQRYEFEAERMATTFRVVLYAEDATAARAAADDAFQRAEELNAVFSDYEPLSEVSRLSRLATERAPTEARLVSDELFTVLLEARRFHELSNGAFDVTIGPFTRLWRRSYRQQELPSEERLAAARAAVGFDGLALDALERSVVLRRKDMRIDLGGLAIGYTLDDLMARLASRGIDRALIDAGGDVLVSGPPPGEDAWTIAIEDLASEDAGQRQVPLVHAAITTSGDLYKVVTIEGVRYSHIVDPATGLGLTTSVTATAIARRAIEADALATIGCLVAPAEAQRIAAALDAEVMIVTAAGEIR
jgi:thiamine biosynthesis lipoprotein